MNDGGLVITEGGTSSFLTQNGVTAGMTIDQQGDLYAPGSVIKAMLGDKTSPVLYGYDQNSIGTMFKSSPLFGLTASPHPPTTAPVAQGGGGGRGGGGGGGPVGGGAMQPMSAAPRLTTLDGPGPRLKRRRAAVAARALAAAVEAAVVADAAAAAAVALRRCRRPSWALRHRGRRA